MFRRTAIVLLLLLGAWTHGGGSATGSAQINLGVGDFIPANIINIFKTASLSFSTLSDAGKVDDDGYLTSSPSGDVGMAFPATGTMWTNTQYKLRWDAGVQFSNLRFLTNMTACSATAATVTGCTGSGNTSIATTGGAGSVIFTTSTAQLSVSFVGGSTASHSDGALSLYRLSDETDFLAGEIYTPEFKTVLRGLNPKIIRPMQWVQRGNGNFNGETTWNYRFKPTTFVWAGGRYPPGAWAGTVTGTDQYTSPAAPDTPLSGWVANEVLVGAISNPSSASITVSNAANNGSGLCRLTVNTTAALTTNQQVWVADVELSTSEPNYACSNALFLVTVVDATHVDLQGTTFSGTYRSNTGAIGTQTLTVTGKTGGAKFIASNLGFPLGYAFGSNITTGIGTFVYDGILDKVLYSSGGIQGSVPIEAQVNLANKINTNLWTIVPPWVSDDYVTNWGAALCSGLNVNLYPYEEYSNEVWNFGFPQTHWATQRGLALGWTVGSGQALYGWYSLRVRQIMGSLLPAVCSRPMRRVMAYQAAGDSSNINNRFKGAQLVPGNAAYNAYTGSANYSVKPNRPIDTTEVMAIAPYIAGTNLCTGPDIGCTPTADNAPFYQALVTAWEAGQFATAIAMVDNDLRTGTTLSQTVTASGTTFTTPLAHGFTANSTPVVFHVTGGTLYSGLAINTLYRVTTTPTASTFTIQPYVAGFPSGANVNAGSAGSGTVTVGASALKNMSNVASTWYQFAESNAAVFDGDRPAGMANVRNEQYEGNLEPVGLSAAQCTTLGITGSNCAGSITAAVLAWKADPSAALTQTAYFNQFMGTDVSMPSTFGLMPHSRTPSQFVLPNVCGGGVLTGAGAYAILSDCLPNSTPFQTYNGFAAFNSGLN